MKETRWVSSGGEEDDDLVAGSNHNPAVIYHRPLLNPLLHPLSRLLEETRWVSLGGDVDDDLVVGSKSQPGRHLPSSPAEPLTASAPTDVKKMLLDLFTRYEKTSWTV